MAKFTLPLTRMLMMSAFVVATFPAFGWQDTNSRAPTLIPAPDHVSPVVRAARNNIYAPLVQSRPSLLERSPGVPHPTATLDVSALPELPVEISQVVVVGKVINITPWLITGDKGLYSEYQIAVNSVLMNRSNWQQDGTLDLVEIGGSAQIPNVGIVTYQVNGLGMQIETGSSYLLFLNYQPRAQCFTFVKAWDVSTGQAVAVSNDDLFRVKQKTSTVNGRPLPILVAEVQALVGALGK